MLEFPNMTTLKKWYNSDDYQNIIADRTGLEWQYGLQGYDGSDDIWG